MAKKQPPVSPPEPGAQPKPARRLKPALLVVLIVLVAVVLSVLGTWMVFRKLAGDPAAETAAVAERQESARPSAIYEQVMPAFVVNYNVNGRQRYMQVSIALMGRDAASMAAFTQHMPVLRNRLVLLLGRQDFEVLSTPAGKEMLRQQVTADVQELARQEVGAPTVEQVLFTNFVLQ